MQILLRTISHNRKLIEQNRLPSEAMQILAERLTAPVRLGLQLSGGEFLVYDKERCVVFNRLVAQS